MHFDPHTGAAGPFEATDDEILPELRTVERPPFQWEGFAPAPHHPDDPPVQMSPLLGEGLDDGIATLPDRWIRMACDTARRSVETGGGPFGAVVVQVDATTGRVLRHWLGRNHVTSSSDPTAHAEVSVLRAACRDLGVFHLDGITPAARLPQPSSLSYCVLYSSTEPCPMCYASLRWARVRRLCFASTRFDAAVPGVEFSDLAFYDEIAAPYADRSFPVFQSSPGNALDAFNLWKRIAKTGY
jgi:guanine deaminase